MRVHPAARHRRARKSPNLPILIWARRKGWRRILARVGLQHVGSHGIRHRSATDIANSGVPVKVGMARVIGCKVNLALFTAAIFDNVQLGLGWRSRSMAARGTGAGQRQF